METYKTNSPFKLKTQKSIYQTVFWLGLLSIGNSLVMYLDIVPNNIFGGLIVLLTMGLLFEAIGRLSPGFQKIGGTTILAILGPSILVYFDLIPQNSIEAVRAFISQFDFQNFYVYILISGSILGMDRLILVKGLSRLLIPIFVGLALGLLIPSTIGWLIGLGFKYSLFSIAAPMMSGGIAAGVLPLAGGLSEISSQTYAEWIATLIPAAIIGNIFALITTVFISFFGEKFPKHTGYGQLIKEENQVGIELISEDKQSGIDLSFLGSGLFFVVSLYSMTLILRTFFSIPLPVILIIICLIIKMANLIPRVIERNIVQLSNIITNIFSLPILISIGIEHFSLEEVKGIFELRYLCVVLSVIVTLVATGFILSRFLGMYPIEASIISLNQAALGGMGNISILSIANRNELMPFAQVVTRIGGAVTIAIVTVLYSLIN